ncbi:MAG: histidinol dehydrogenase [Gammaproteobacteria bacterium]|nr:histidinol dehydrogenase [Gammaproteobacteria bacterium]MBT4462929.1 histidinol dehydrogenase [Gammaproteobacteria bacterium]MBT4654648.1 histidinol dehydrogenase [Gammaproteobacteria bacterium]MBT5761334.1 histidinol dehydrogenase [Gammaproteobacteria bacterium]MBT7932977.1 histidinol dehydrogenase [Gammaproteobacteria bacterium]
MKINPLRIDTSKRNYEKIILSRTGINSNTNRKVQKEVDLIISKIKKSGDKSLLSFIKKFDNYNIKNIKNILITPNEIKKSYKYIDKYQLSNLKKSIKRIRDFSKKQKAMSWSNSKNGSILGEKVTAIETVGIYVPAGKASYPSTVLMNAIPAKIAGVENIIMACPISNIEDHALAIVAADLCGVDKILRMGGAHAIAALAYGTNYIDKVDKIVGPGNIYVTLAKKAVFGDVGIDNIAGPSEVVIIADSTNNPDWVAMDLFSQAEHDELAQPILISSNMKLINDVHKSVEKLLPQMLRKNIILKSFNSRGIYIKTKNMREIANIVNKIAPEHLEIMSKNKNDLIKLITNAGAIFLGEYTPEVFGDYCAGPNHVLPTSGSARFSSPLGVYDFQKRSSLINISRKTALELSKISVSMALSEGLQAHALSAKYRDK